jgi:intraflagellar transport protein 140
MSLYLDTKVQFLDDETISTIGVWHKNYPTFAVANYSQERGGSVTLFDDGVSMLCVTSQEKRCVNFF